MAIDFKQFEKLDTVAALKQVPAGIWTASSASAPRICMTYWRATRK